MMYMSCPECENRLASNFKNQKVDLSLLDPVLDEYKGEKSNIIAILQKTQEIYRFLPLDALNYISEKQV